ncbi:hypothetical protein ACFQY5_28900 [Paeniroseomonas aquatica]|uniref:Uncharacterized protein n=1 Tax=Paeniroseomonas aquatica TaxID=373043 RepID=A0ABT8AFF0_9PROT|nr:hypothetical protein [Paeniroseomonas aquatica]MDN3568258.1 hypothetical protein [Paeniroseomonas aquatica]
MIPRLALLLPLLGAALLACSPTVAPVESSRVERGTALPPPGLAAPR